MRFQRYQRLPVLLAGAGLGVLLSGCVVAPVGPGYGGAYVTAPAVYVNPAPVVVAPRYYHGYRGYRPYGYWR